MYIQQGTYNSVSHYLLSTVKRLAGREEEGIRNDELCVEWIEKSQPNQSTGNCPPTKESSTLVVSGERRRPTSESR